MEQLCGICCHLINFSGLSLMRLTSNGSVGEEHDEIACIWAITIFGLFYCHIITLLYLLFYNLYYITPSNAGKTEKLDNFITWEKSASVHANTKVFSRVRSLFFLTAYLQDRASGRTRATSPRRPPCPRRCTPGRSRQPRGQRPGSGWGGGAAPWLGRLPADTNMLTFPTFCLHLFQGSFFRTFFYEHPFGYSVRSAPNPMLPILMVTISTFISPLPGRALGYPSVVFLFFFWSLWKFCPVWQLWNRNSLARQT